MKLGAAQGNGGVDRQDATIKGRLYLPRQPRAQHGAPVRVLALDQKNADLQLLDGHDRYVKVGRFDTISPARDAWGSPPCPHLAQLRDDVRVQQVHQASLAGRARSVLRTIGNSMSADAASESRSAIFARLPASRRYSSIDSRT